MSGHHHYEDDAHASGGHGGAAHTPHFTDSQAPAVHDHPSSRAGTPHHRHHGGAAASAAHHQHSAAPDSPSLPRHAYERGYVRSASSSSRSRSRSPRRSDGSFQQPHARFGQDQWAHGEYGRRAQLSPPQQQRWEYHPQHQIRDAPPSSTLIVRGLSLNVTDIMIMDALAAFRPLSTHIIYNKATGESRGFAFVEFSSVDDARQVVLAYTHGPLHLDNRPLAIGYKDTSRPPNRWAGGDGDWHQALPPGGGGHNRLDWICTECNRTNFARRTVCFKCEAPRAEHAREMPQDQTAAYLSHSTGGGEGPPPPADQFQSRGRALSSGGGSSHEHGHRASEELDLPSQVLLVRDLPQYIEEGELHIAFAEFEGVNDIRLIRDRLTNQTRGFGFVEFVDAESAKKALNLCGNLRVQGQQVRVSFARDSRFPKQHSKASSSYPPAFSSSSAAGGENLPSMTANSMAAAALEQAQWSLSNGHNGSRRENSSLDADVDAFLQSAVAAIGYVERPKKQWPLPFETGGGSYVFVSECGLYYDHDSMFYYDTQSKLYYNSFSGSYYRCVDGAKGMHATFSPFVPPVPTDETTYGGSNGAMKATSSTGSAFAGAGAPGAIGAFSLTLNKKKPIAINIVAAASKLKGTFTTPSSSSGATTAVDAASGPSTSMKRKSADDIAKWSQLQRASKGEREEAVPGSRKPVLTPVKANAASTESTPQTELDNLVNAVAAEAPICLLCRRKFSSMDLLRKHETLSKLHLENLAKAKANKEVITAQYRGMEQERNERLGSESSDRKRQRVPNPPAAQASAPALAPTRGLSQTPPTPITVSSLESGIGGKMLKMMGWKSGQGLGKHGTGITTPVTAVGNAGNETAGIGARSTASKAPSVPIDLSDMASYKERLQQMARARYDSTPRGL